MRKQQLFLDTSYAQALLNPRDQHREASYRLRLTVARAGVIWTTHFVLAEIANGLSATHRREAADYIDQFFSDTTEYRVVDLNIDLFNKGLLLYRNYQDKDWGLTDCISFVVMRDLGLTAALTTDQHFVQAGFRALMLETT